MVHTWNSVSSSEALTTALAPGMFSYLSQYYEMIENENRRYTQWEDGLYGLVIAAGSWTQEEKRATQANRRTWFRQRQGVVKVIHDQYPRAEESPRCEPRRRSIEPEDRGRPDADGVDVRGADRLGGWTRVPAGGRRAPPVTPAQAYPTCRGRRNRAIIRSGLTAAVSSAVVSISCASETKGSSRSPSPIQLGVQMGCRSRRSGPPVRLLAMGSGLQNRPLGRTGPGWVRFPGPSARTPFRQRLAEFDR